jgi:hypothetical protein
LELWQIISLLAAGAVGVGALAKSSAAQATAASQPSLSAQQLSLLSLVYQAAMTNEKNIAILKTFSTKLSKAGFGSYAASVNGKVDILSRVLAPMPLAITMIQQTPTAQTQQMQPTTITNPTVAT